MKKKKTVNDLLKEGPRIINIGLKSFHEDNKKQDIPSVHVNWQPSAGGDKELQDILSKIL